jgi:alcohol dehydrogenase class IV
MKRESLFPPTVDEMCRDAMARIAEYLNRSAAQHRHHIREGFAVARSLLLRSA